MLASGPPGEARLERHPGGAAATNQRTVDEATAEHAGGNGASRRPRGRSYFDRRALRSRARLQTGLAARVYGEPAPEVNPALNGSNGLHAEPTSEPNGHANGTSAPSNRIEAAHDLVEHVPAPAIGNGHSLNGASFNLAARVYGGRPATPQTVVATAPPPPPEAPTTTEAAPAPRRRWRPRTFEALSFSPFRWYLGAMIWWNAAMSMQMLVRGYLAYHLTGSFAALGTVGLGSAIPMLLLSPFGGVVADRTSRRAVLQVGQLFSLVVALVVAALLFADMLTFWHLVLASVAQGTMMALVMPSRQSFLPEVVGMQRLMNAIPLQSASMNVMQLIGPTVGGFLIDWLGAGSVYSVMAAMYAMSVLLLFAVKSLTPEQLEASRRAQPARGGATGRGGGRPAAARGGARGNPLKDLRSGLAYAARDHVILSVLAFAFLGSVLGMPIRMLLPGYVAEVFGDAGSTLGIMQMGMGFGALVGSLVLASLRLERHRGLIFAGSVTLMGVSMILFSMLGVFWMAWLSILAIGVASAGRMTLSQMLIQDYVEEEYRGRVMSLFMMQISVMNIGTFAVSIYMDYVGPQFAIGSLGVALVAASLAYVAFVPRFRRLR
ncbi:MAG: MFS transporter [Dehalococcoidia bacterium]